MLGYLMPPEQYMETVVGYGTMLLEKGKLDEKRAKKLDEWVLQYERVYSLNKM